MRRGSFYTYLLVGEQALGIGEVSRHTHSDSALADPCAPRSRGQGEGPCEARDAKDEFLCWKTLLKPPLHGVVLVNTVVRTSVNTPCARIKS